MLIKYRAQFYGSAKIQKVECTRESDKCVWLKVESRFEKITESRRKKVTERECYFDTWEDAHEWLMEIVEARLNGARLSLQRAQGEYGNVKGMRNE